MAMRRGRVVGVALGLAALIGACGEEEEAANTPPVFVGGEAEYRTRVDTPVSFEVTARDDDGDPVTLAMIQGPEAAQFAAPEALGRFFWAPISSDAAPGGMAHEVIFEARDSRGGRATFRTQVVVEPNDGAPRFVTTNQRVLDLARTAELRAEVRVKDDDSSRVELRLVEPPEGMTLTQLDDKSAEIRWTPTERQIEKKLVWGAQLVADDGASDLVTQQLTVILIAKACGEAAAIQHTPLGEQRGVSDYVVQAAVPGAAGVAPTLFWRRGGDPNETGGFEGVLMEAAGGDTFAGRIPNPLVAEGKYDDIFYFIVGVGGESGDVCTNRAPEAGFYSFTAYPPGDTSCRQDSLEPNDSIAQAPVLDTSRTAGFEGYNLSLCDGDRDLYAVELGEGQGASALIIFNEDDGALRIRALGMDGNSVLAESTDQYRDSASVLFAGMGAGKHYLEVSGDRNAYSLFVVPRDNVDPNCVDTELEPNDTARDSIILDAGLYEGLKLCAGDNDYFAVEVPRGMTLTARARFAQSSGDIDLFLRDTNDQIVARAVSADDNEELVFTNDRPVSTHILQVRDYDDNPKNYSLELILSDGGGDTCVPDFLEPNDTASAARGFPVDALNDSGATMCGDDDFYAFQAQAGDPIEASIRFDGQAIDMDLALLGPDDRVIQVSDGIEGTERVQANATTSGLHAIRVYRYSGDMGTAEYRVSLSVGGASNNPGNNSPAGCRMEDTEPNDAIAFAALLEGDEARGLGACASDTDWWAFLGSDGGDLLVDIIPEDSSGGDPFTDLSVDLLDSEGRMVLDAGTRTNNAISVGVSGTQEDFYLVRVRNLSTSNYHNYRMEFVTF